MAADPADWAHSSRRRSPVPALPPRSFCCLLPGDETRRRRQMGALETSFEATIARSHHINPPNEPAKRLAAELADTISAFEALRGTLAFEDEPSSFEAALQ